MNTLRGHVVHGAVQARQRADVRHQPGHPSIGANLVMKALRFLRGLALLSLVVLPISAQAADLAVPGIPNFQHVNAHVLRGGQPADVAWQKLANMGVKTVIDLRRESEHSTAAEARAVEAAGMRYVNVPMSGFKTPRAEQVAKVLDLMDGGDIVFVHCKHGKDRTGTVVAAYRISRDRWANQKALDEAESYGLHWYERGMKRFIRDYLVADRTPVKVTGSRGTATASPAVPSANR